MPSPLPPLVHPDLARLAIGASERQRRAYRVSRWASLNSDGAFLINDAAGDLEEAAKMLRALSFRLMADSGKFRHVLQQPTEKKIA